MPHDLTFGNLKTKQANKTKQTHRYREIWVIDRGEGMGGCQQVKGIKRYKPLVIREIGHRDIIQNKECDQ